MVKSLYKMVDSIAKTLNKNQRFFQTFVGAMPHHAPASVMMEVVNKEVKYISEPELYSFVVNNQAVSIVSEISDQDRRCNFMVHNLPEPVQSLVQTY